MTFLQKVKHFFGYRTIEDREVKKLLFDNGWHDVGTHEADMRGYHAFQKAIEEKEYNRKIYYYSLQNGNNWMLTLTVSNKTIVLKEFANVPTKREIETLIKTVESHFVTIHSEIRQRVTKNSEIIVKLIQHGFNTNNTLLEEAKKYFVDMFYFYEAFDYLHYNKIMIIDENNIFQIKK